MLNEQTQTIESANSVLSQALEAAETLSAALSEESEKFNNLDSETGILEQDIDTERLEQLAEQLERLRAEAAALQSR